MDSYLDKMEATDNITIQENFTCGKWNWTDYENNVQFIHGWWVRGLLSIIIGLFGVIFNLLMIVVLSSQDFRKIFFNKLIISLTISDIIFLGCCGYESLRRHFLDELFWANCSVPGYIQLILYPLRKITLCFSIYLAVVLSFERYLAVTTPIITRNRFIESSWSRRFLKYMSIVFLVTIVFGTPLFFAFKMEFNPHEGTYCLSPWLRLNKMYILLFHNLTNFIITGAIPFLSLFCLNCRTYLTIRQSLKTHRQLQRTRTKNFGDNLGEKIPTPQDNDKDILLSTVLLVYIMSFFICHVLRVALNLEEIIFLQERNEVMAIANELGVHCTWVQFWTEVAGGLSHFLLQVNSSINFFIYCYISSKFQKVLKEKIFRWGIVLRKHESSQRYSGEDKNGTATIPLTNIK